MFWLGLSVHNGFGKAFLNGKFLKLKSVVIYKLLSIWDSTTNYAWVEKMVVAARLFIHVSSWAELWSGSESYTTHF